MWVGKWDLVLAEKIQTQNHIRMSQIRKGARRLLEVITAIGNIKLIKREKSDKAKRTNQTDERKQERNKCRTNPSCTPIIILHFGPYHLSCKLPPATQRNTIEAGTRKCCLAQGTSVADA